MTSSNTWKRSEARSAKRIGSVRTPLSGSNGKLTASDSLSGYWFMENKLKATVTLFNMFHTVYDMAKHRKKEPLMIFFSKGEKYAVFSVKKFYLTTNMHLPRYDSLFDGNWYIDMQYNEMMPYRHLYIKTAEKAAKEKKVPIVIIHKKGMQIDIGIMELSLFLSHLPSLPAVITVPEAIAARKVKQ